MIKRISGDFIEWCKSVVASNDYVLLDCETTGLAGEVCDLGICDINGNILYDGLLKPACAIEEEAMKIHHITEDMVANAPCFHDEWPEIEQKLKCKGIIAYNAQFDAGRLRHTATAHNVTLPDYEYFCCMMEYAQYWGEHGRYNGCRWQKLEDALGQQGIYLGEQQHRALGDAQATAALIRKIATLGENATTWLTRER